MGCSGDLSRLILELERERRSRGGGRLAAESLRGGDEVRRAGERERVRDLRLSRLSLEGERLCAEALRGDDDRRGERLSAEVLRGDDDRRGEGLSAGDDDGDCRPRSDALSCRPSSPVTVASRSPRRGDTPA